MTQLLDPSGLCQSRASDSISEEAVRRHRALVEDLAAIGGHIAYATHDEVHFHVPEDRVAEGEAIMERYLQDYVSAIMDAVPPVSAEPDLATVWLARAIKGAS